MAEQASKIKSPKLDVPYLKEHPENIKK
jgi:hypothetical protein